jgi:flagellar biosynthesis protein FlhB
MAEESAAERTEEATQRKKQQAREKGNVPKSRDLSAAVVLFSAVLFLKYFGGWMFGNLADSVGRFLENAPVLAVPDGDSMIGYMFEWVYAYAICDGTAFDDFVCGCGGGRGFSVWIGV